MKCDTLRGWRKTRGLTQEQLEVASGVSQSLISNIERAEVTDPAFSNVVKLATALRIDPKQITFGVHAEVA